MFVKLMRKLPLDYCLSCISWPLRPVPSCSPQALDSVLARSLWDFYSVSLSLSSTFWIQQTLGFSAVSLSSFSVLLRNMLFVRKRKRYLPVTQLPSSLFFPACPKHKPRPRCSRLLSTFLYSQLMGFFWLPLFTIIRHRPLPASGVLWFL